MEIDTDKNPSGLTLSALPIEIHAHILLQLPVKAIVSRLALISTSWKALIDTNSIWKDLTYRDWQDFLTTSPVLDSHFRSLRVDEEPRTESYENSPFAEWSRLNPHEKLAFSIHDSMIRVKEARTDLEVAHESIASPTSWKAQYIEFFIASKFNISGSNWFAIYGGHGMERIQVTQKGYKITTKKLIGDVNIPTGKPTFEITLRRNGKCGVGRIHLAETGYQNPYWGFCSLEIHEPGLFYVHWYLAATYVYTKRFWIEEREEVRRGVAHEI